MVFEKIREERPSSHGSGQCQMGQKSKADSD